MKYHANLSLDTHLYKKVQKVARDKDTTVSAIVESLLRAYIEDNSEGEDVVEGK